MGVGEYIHAKEGDRRQPFQRSNTEQLFKVQRQQQQQQLQEQDRQLQERTATSTPQYSRFTRPFSWQNEAYTQQLQQQQQEEEAANYKSVFDTDVEGVDDSTITVTSVAADNNSNDDHGFELFGTRHVTAINWNDTVPSESDHSLQPAENDQVGVDEDYGKRTPVSVIGDETDAKKKVTDTLDWVRYQVSQQSATDDAPPKRKSIGRADHSRIPMPSSRMTLIRSDSDPVPRFSAMKKEDEEDGTRMGRMSSANRRNLSRSLATTPNNRFNFKTERPYERLIQQQQSPTRRASGPRPQPERQSSSKSTGLFRRDQAKKERKKSFNYYDTFLDNGRIRSTFDATDDEGPEDDTLSIINLNSSPNTQHHIPAAARSLSDFDQDPKFESDYPDQVLQQMQYSQLEKEPFDHTPTTPPANPSTPKKIPPALSSPKKQTHSDAKTASEKLTYVLNSLPVEEDRHRYLSSMTMTEWEEFGDELIGRLGEMMNKIKEARHARRRTTAIFEAEIKRRNDEAQRKTRELDRKLADMKQGGMGMLKGLKPA